MIVAAQGEAMSAELIGKAVQRNAAYVTLRKIETAKEISKILAQGSNRLILDAEALLLNVRENEKYIYSCVTCTYGLGKPKPGDVSTEFVISHLRRYQCHIKFNTVVIPKSQSFPYKYYNILFTAIPYPLFSKKQKSTTLVTFDEGPKSCLPPEEKPESPSQGPSIVPLLSSTKP
jgi:hypothetical protein